MMKGASLKILAGICALTALTSISGVWANWTFFSPPKEYFVTVPVKIGVWPDDVVLPSTPGDTQIGENYNMLLEAILYSTKAGLNPTDLLEDAIWNTKKNGHHLGLLYSQQNVTGGNQGHLFDKDTNAGTASLLFAMESIDGSKTEYYFYLYKKSDAEDAVLENNLSTEKISAYRAHVKYENGEWVSVGTFAGKAYVYQPNGDYFQALKTTTWIRT